MNSEETTSNFPCDHFSLWVSALGCLLSAWPAFSPAQGWAWEMHLGGARGSNSGGERERESKSERIKFAESLICSFQHLRQILLLTPEQEGWKCSKWKDQQKKNNTSFPLPSFLASSSPPLPSSPCLGDCCTTEIHRQLQLLPLSWPFHNSKGYLMSLEK